jgi:hypothetical protein
VFRGPSGYVSHCPVSRSLLDSAKLLFVAAKTAWQGAASQINGDLGRLPCELAGNAVGDAVRQAGADGLAGELGGDGAVFDRHDLRRPQDLSTSSARASCFPSLGSLPERPRLSAGWPSI